MKITHFILLLCLTSCSIPENINSINNSDIKSFSKEKDIFNEYLLNQKDKVVEERLINYILDKSNESLLVNDYNRSFEFLLKGLKLNIQKFNEDYFKMFFSNYSKIYSLNEESEENYNNFIYYIKSNINNKSLLIYAYKIQKDFYIKEHDLNKAKKSFDEMIKLYDIFSLDKDAFYKYILEITNFYTWFYENDQDSMINLYNELLVKHKISENSILELFYNSLSDLYKSKGDYIKAFEYLNKISKMYNDNILSTQILKNLIDLYIILDDEKNMLKYYQKLISKNNNNEKCSYKNIGNYYYSKKQYQEAIKYYNPENCN